MLESKSSLQTGVQNLGSSSPKIEGRKTTYFGRSSATLQLKVDLTADIFWTKRDKDNPKMTQKTTKAPTFCQNFIFSRLQMAKI